MPYVTREPINLPEWHTCAIDPRDGASVEFVGIVRGTEDGIPIAALEYEAHVPMAERVIEGLIEQVKQRWPIHQVYVRHRMGRVPVGQIAVLIGVRCPHRDQAFEACRFLINAIKQDVPIWKTAISADGMALEVICAHGNQAQ